jgi:hypothetical protein
MDVHQLELMVLSLHKELEFNTQTLVIDKLTLSH